MEGFHHQPRLSVYGTGGSPAWSGPDSPVSTFSSLHNDVENEPARKRLQLSRASHKRERDLAGEREANRHKAPRVEPQHSVKRALEISPRHPRLCKRGRVEPQEHVFPMRHPLAGKRAYDSDVPLEREREVVYERRLVPYRQRLPNWVPYERRAPSLAPELEYPFGRPLQLQLNPAPPYPLCLAPACLSPPPTPRVEVLDDDYDDEGYE